jgi:MFS transporter, SP family, sugar:H+ symporter
MFCQLPPSQPSTNTICPVPLYQSETAPKWIRGFIVGAYQWAITIGLLLAAVVNNATSNRNDTGSYRIPIAIQLAWSLILFSGVLVLPETPRYLIKKDKAEKAAISLSRLRRLPVDHEAIAVELAEVEASYRAETTVGQGSYLDCFRAPILKRQLTGMGLQALQQLTGKLHPSISNTFSIPSTTGAHQAQPISFFQSNRSTKYCN